MPGIFGPLAVELKDVFGGSAGTVTSPAFGKRATVTLVPPAAPLGLLPQPVDRALASMAAQHNAVHSDPGKQADPRALRAVYRRGASSFNKRRHPSLTRRQWGMRRVRQHLSALAGGGARLDRDLLPTKHPEHQASKVGQKALLVIEGGRGLPTAFELKATVVLRPDVALFRRRIGHGGVWDPQKHPRDLHGRFGRVLADLAAQVSKRRHDGITKGVNAQAAGVLREAGGHLAAAAEASRKLDPNEVRGQLSDATTVLQAGHAAADEKVKPSLAHALEAVRKLHREYRAAHEAGWLPTERRDPNVLGVVKKQRKSLTFALDPSTLPQLEVKAIGHWDAKKHPRDKNGRFVHIGAEVEALVDGKQIRGSVTAVDKGKATIRDASGAEHVVKAKQTEVLKNHEDVQKGLKDAVSASRRLQNAAIRSNSGHRLSYADAEDRFRAAHDAVKEGDFAGAEEHLRKAEQVQRAFRGYRTMDTAQHERHHDDLAARAHEHRMDAERMQGKEPTGPEAAGPLRDPLDQRYRNKPITRTGAPKLGDARPDGQPWGSGYAPGDPRNDPRYDRYVADLDARLTHALEQHGDTATLFENPDHPGTGIPTEERKAVHEAILGRLMADYDKMPRERKALFMAGLPGAGKSTLISSHGHEFGVQLNEDGSPANFATVNADDMKGLLVEHGGVPDPYQSYGFGPGEMASLYHEESSELAKELQRRLIGQGTNVLVDGTFGGKTRKQIEKVAEVRGQGYDVTGVLVDVPLRMSAERAGGRHTQGNAPMVGVPLGGRYVPASVAGEQAPHSTLPSEMLGSRSHLSHASENFEAAAHGGAFNGGVHVFDNSVTGRPRKLFESSHLTGDEAPKA